MSIPPMPLTVLGERMREAMRQIESRFPDCTVALVVAPFGTDASCVGNARRDDIAAILREMLASWEKK